MSEAQVTRCDKCRKLMDSSEHRFEYRDSHPSFDHCEFKAEGFKLVLNIEPIFSEDPTQEILMSPYHFCEPCWFGMVEKYLSTRKQ